MQLLFQRDNVPVVSRASFSRSLLSASLLLGTSSIAAAQSRSALSWTAPANCPSETEFEASVARVLGHPVRGTSQVAFLARAIVSRENRGWKLIVHTLRDGVWHPRELHASTCRAVARAAAVVVAFIIDPAAVLQAAPPPPRTTPQRWIARRASPQRPSPPLDPLARAANTLATPARVETITQLPTLTPRSFSEPALPAIEVQAPPPSPMHARPMNVRAQQQEQLWSVRFSGGLDSGALPYVSSFFQLGIARRTGVISWEGAVGYGAPQTATVPSAPQYGGTFQLLVASVAACPVGTWRSLQLGGCIGLEAGTLWGAGQGIASPSTAWGPWFAAITMGTVRWRMVPRWGLRIDVGAAIPVARPRYVIDELSLVHQPAEASFRGMLSLEYFF